MKEWLAPYLTVFISLALLVLLGILTPEEAFIGFSNPGVITVALLFIIGSAVHKSGVLYRWVVHLLGKTKSLSLILVKIMSSVSFLSAFMNNTPIVTILTPILQSWCSKHHLSPSKILIPLSYAAILGGTITLIGTSTNLIIHGLLQQKGLPGFTMFQFIYIGIPLTIVGLIYMVVTGQHRLPERTNMMDTFHQSNRDWIVRFRVPEHSELIGQSIKSAQLRELKDGFLIGVARRKRMILPVSNQEVIQSGDRLIFAGDPQSIIELARTKNMILETKSEEHVTYENGPFSLVEAVISSTSPLLHKKVKESHFRSKYNAAIIAVRRNNKDVTSGIGEMVFRPGDVLLLITGKDFGKTWSDSADFHIVSSENLSFANDIDIFAKSKIVIATLIGVIILSAFQMMPILYAALLGVLILILTKSITPVEVRSSVDIGILILMASSIGIGQAIEKTGLSSIIAGAILQTEAIFGVFGVALFIYICTNILTEIMNNIAAAAFMFPIGYSVAITQGIDPMFFSIIIAIAASCSFITPIGYQTNLLVYGPGGYRFTDYMKVGFPLSILCMMVTVIMAIVVWG
ncbi:di/tricarboxylate transporter [Caldalkalibacillus uzonensis]|uniref:Di/tricarboxylate transporter n=1 Tax=Caldalkalibacillus uzonensis TaxID=353224 RepID=A0ABU0CRF7_9BACI|nr:SLC13 family permease [Caldalkalibacillus uzonensis]MDQ0339010.1 di/tricarboxylate transporter [Caldalkalibacillus uzonensis]